MLQIEGMGPKTIHVFWKDLNITSLEELIGGDRIGKAQGLERDGREKDRGRFRRGSRRIRAASLAIGSAPQRTGIADAEEQAEPLVEAVRKIPGVMRAEIAGSLRRRKETIGDVDLIASVQDVTEAEDA